MKVAAYIRVSTDEQAQEGYSIPAQRNRLEAYAISQGWEIVRWYVDEGESAKDLNRTSLKQLLETLEQGVFDCVLVYRLDRLTRSVLDLYQLLNTFEKHNVKFKSATEVYDTTTAIGRLFITLVAALAQWERENLGERVRMGMQQKAREGKWTVSTPPMGYDSIDSQLVINQSEALVVKEIFNQYLSGAGMLKIAKEFNEKGISSKKGNNWAQTTIAYILKNPIYIGKTRYNYRVNKEQYFEVEGNVPAIVSEEEFLMAQQMIEGRKNSHPRQATSKYIFSKVLKCARCGTTLIGRSSMTYGRDKVTKYYSYNYYCRNNAIGLCDLPKINESLLEKQFISMIDKWDFTDEANEAAQKESNETESNYEEEIKALNEELKQLEKRRSKWQYAWVNEMLTDIDFKKRTLEENEKEKMILKELDKLKPQESLPDNHNTTEMLTNLKMNWSVMNREIKKQFVLIAIQSMKVDKINSNKTADSIGIGEVKFN